VQVPAQQTSGRKRAARSLGLPGGDTTVRQQNAVLKHLAELDKDSHRDVQIPVPKDSAGRGWSST
jgi:zinc finger HIT domain-containing protein 1